MKRWALSTVDCRNGEVVSSASARFVVSRENMEPSDKPVRIGTISIKEGKGRIVSRVNHSGGFRLLFLPAAAGMKGNFWSGLDRLYGV